MEYQRTPAFKRLAGKHQNMEIQKDLKGVKSWKVRQK